MNYLYSRLYDTYGVKAESLPSHAYYMPRFFRVILLRAEIAASGSQLLRLIPKRVSPEFV
jgi:hypothetical protein